LCCAIGVSATAAASLDRGGEGADRPGNVRAWDVGVAGGAPVENFVDDDTPFLASHYRKALAETEGAGEFQYLGRGVRRRGTYADKAAVLVFR
jgi:hypothetical protein